MLWLSDGEEVIHARLALDHYISSVMKAENQANSIWRDRVPTIACLEGVMLVCDEFERAPACASSVPPTQADAA